MSNLVGTQEDSTQLPELRVGSIDGVKAVWAPTVSGSCTAAIVFRVGQLDEKLPERGWTHLIEHLALNHLKDEHFAFNGATGWYTTTFHARGTAPEMAEFLRGVTNKLVYLPYDRIEQEAKILGTEKCSRGLGATNWILMNLYGATGPGVTAYDEFGLERATQLSLEAWRAKYFTKSNAYIWFTGPTPLPQFTIGLPEGEGEPMRMAEFAPVEKLPMWTNAGSGAVAVISLVDDVPALGCALHVLERRMTERLRHQAGLSYSVSTSRVSAGCSRDMVFLIADHRDGDAEEVQQFMDNELKSLIANPPSIDEIHHWRNVTERFYRLETESAAASSASEWAENSLLGWVTRTPAQVLSDAQDVTPSHVAHAIQQILTNAAWGMPEGTRISDRRIFPPSAPTWRAQGELFIRSGQSGTSGSSQAMILSREGVSLAFSGRDQQSVRFGELALARHEKNGSITLIERTGFSINVNPSMWHNGDRLLADVVASVPVSLLIGLPAPAEAIPHESGTIILTKAAIEQWDNISVGVPDGYKAITVTLPSFTAETQAAPQKLGRNAQTVALQLVVPANTDAKNSPVTAVETAVESITVQCTSPQLTDQIRRRALAATWAKFDVEPTPVRPWKDSDRYFDAWSLSADVKNLVAAARASQAEVFLETYRGASTDERSIALLKVLDEPKGVERLMNIAAAYGDTSIANTIRGTVAIHMAWEARGSGWGNTVSRDSGEIFLNCLRDADGLFERAVAQDPNHVLPRVKMLITARGLTLGMKERRQRYADIVAIEPDCFTAASQYVQTIAPKWGGDLDELLAFGQQLLDKFGYGHPLNAVTIEAHAEARHSRATPQPVLAKIANQTAMRRQMIESLSVAVAQRPTPLNIRALNTVTCMAWRLQEEVLVNRGFEALRGRITASPWTDYDNAPTPQTATPKAVDFQAVAKELNRMPTHTVPGKSSTKPSRSSMGNSVKGAGSGFAFLAMLAAKVWLTSERQRGRA